MNDLISRIEALTKIKGCYQSLPLKNRKAWQEKYEGYIKAYEIIKDLPTVEPKTGRWIKTRSYGDYWECDQCGCAIATKHPFKGFWSYNYCPNCGSEMEMGVDPNNCGKCELANECDLHICIKGVRKRMSERSKE